MALDLRLYGQRIVIPAKRSANRDRSKLRSVCFTTPDNAQARFRGDEKSAAPRTG
jgi:hypothetical protein